MEPHPQNFERMEKLRPNAHHLGLAPSCNSTSDIVRFPKHIFTNAVANEEGASLEIHCGPLSYYLDQLGITHIDFWSLDVEGSELNVLKTVDFDKVHIDVIMAESENRLKDKQKLGAEVRAYLQQKDYLIFNKGTIFKSDVFLHKRACDKYSHLPVCRAVADATPSDGSSNSPELTTHTTIIDDPSVVSNQKQLNTSVNKFIGSKDDIVKCTDDGGDCRGFFHYSPPNHSPNATQLLHETANAYSYGLEKNNDGHLIFFPNHTKSEECIVEWGNARSGIGSSAGKKWKDRGMSAWGEDMIIFNLFFKEKSYLSSDHVYMEIGAHE